MKRKNIKPFLVAMRSLGPKKRRIVLSKIARKSERQKVIRSEPFEFKCDGCNETTPARFSAFFKGKELKLCNKCNTIFKSAYGTFRVDDPSFGWEEPSKKCSFCHKPIEKAGFECDECHGRVKQVGFRGLGRKRRGPIGKAPADVIAAIKNRPKEFNPLNRTSISVHFADLFSDAEINALYNAQDMDAYD